MSASTIAAAVSRLVSEAEVRRSFGRRARQTVVDKLSIEHCLEAHLRANETAVAGHTRPEGRA